MQVPKRKRFSMPNKRHGFIRKFNRIILNPITKLFAGIWVYSLVYHVGRRSGKEYSTPVVATKKGEYVYIPLPYGSDTDWFLNVQTAGKCNVKINGKVYSLSNPEIVETASALSAFSAIFQVLFEKANFKQFLKLSVN